MALTSIMSDNVSKSSDQKSIPLQSISGASDKNPPKVSRAVDAVSGERNPKYESMRRASAAESPLQQKMSITNEQRVTLQEIYDAFEGKADMKQLSAVHNFEKVVKSLFWSLKDEWKPEKAEVLCRLLHMLRMGENPFFKANEAGKGFNKKIFLDIFHDKEVIKIARNLGSKFKYDVDEMWSGKGLDPKDLYYDLDKDDLHGITDVREKVKGMLFDRKLSDKERGKLFDHMRKQCLEISKKTGKELAQVEHEATWTMLDMFITIHMSAESAGEKFDFKKLSW